MVNFAGAAGKAALDKALAGNGGGRYTPSLYWESEKDAKYIQFISDIDGFYTFEGHWMMNLGPRKDDATKTQWESFISPRDPAVDPENGVDLIQDRFGLDPKKRTFAMAVEMEPIVEQVESRSGKKRNSIVGFKPIMRKYTDKDKVEHEVPALGLICESPFSFYTWFNDYADDGNDLSESVFKVSKKGKQKDTRYLVERAGDALPLEDLGLEEDLVERLHSHITELADPARMARLIGALPDSHVLDRFRQKGNTSGAAAARTESVSAPSAEPVESADATPETEQFAALSRRFAGAGN